MSFTTICSGCGAASGPSVGVCPFCKTLMSESGSPKKATITAFIKMHKDGKLEQALIFGTDLLKADPELKTDMKFVVTFVKVMIESEAPSSRIRALLAEAQLSSPENTELLDYVDIVEAKNCLRKGQEDPGELLLKTVIRRSPQNVHAHFILGAHLLWTEDECVAAVPYLETCVRFHPNFLRAWGCLGAIYKKLGNEQLAQAAFQKCASIETNPEMKQFFKNQAKAA